MRYYTALKEKATNTIHKQPMWDSCADLGIHSRHCSD